MRNAHKILDLIQESENGLSVAEIAESLKISRSEVGYVLRRCLGYKGRRVLRREVPLASGGLYFVYSIAEERREGET